MPESPPRGPAFSQQHIRVRISIYESGGHRNIQSIAVTVLKPDTLTTALGCFGWSPRSEVVTDSPTKSETVSNVSGLVLASSSCCDNSPQNGVAKNSRNVASHSPEGQKF